MRTRGEGVPVQTGPGLPLRLTLLFWDHTSGPPTRTIQEARALSQCDICLETQGHETFHGASAI